jgi:hypothetical protein
MIEMKTLVGNEFFENFNFSIKKKNANEIFVLGLRFLLERKIG